MNIREIAKKNQELFEEGIANIYIWKEGRSWKSEAFWYDNPTNETYDIYDEKDIQEIYKKDKYAINLNGYEELGCYGIEYIEYKIKEEYKRNKEFLIEEEKINTTKIEEIAEKTYLHSECVDYRYVTKVLEDNNIIPTFEVQLKENLPSALFQPYKDLLFNLYEEISRNQLFK